MTIDPAAPVLQRRGVAFPLLLMTLGLVAVSSLLLASMEQLLPQDIQVSPVLLLIQPAALVILFTWLGWWAAPKVGLDAPVIGGLADGGDWLGALRKALLPGLVGGVLSAVVLIVYGLGTASYFAGQPAGIDLPMVTRMAYGGIVEELHTRWGLMSLLALGAFKLGRSLPMAHWIGNLGAALLFALGHLPALYALVDPPAWLVAAVLLGNTSVGLVFGWLFARRGLEAAMIAHAGAHLFAVPVLTAIT